MGSPGTPGLLNSATSGPRGCQLLLLAPLCQADHRSHGLSFSSRSRQEGWAWHPPRGGPEGGAGARMRGWVSLFSTQGLKGQSAGPRGQGDPPGAPGCWRACLQGGACLGGVWAREQMGPAGAQAVGEWSCWGGGLCRCLVGASARVYLTRGPAWPWGSPAAPARPGSEAVSARHCGPGWQGPRWAAAAPRLRSLGPRPQQEQQLEQRGGGSGAHGGRSGGGSGGPGLPGRAEGVGGAAGPWAGPGAGPGPRAGPRRAISAVGGCATPSQE